MTEQKVTLKYANEVRASFHIPGSLFRMRCSNKRTQNWYGDNHTEVWTYEVTLPIIQHSQQDGIPAEIWTLSAERTLQRNSGTRSGIDINSLPFKQTKITASVNPLTEVLEEIEVLDSPSRSEVEFFVGMSIGSSSSISKGTGWFKNGVWECTPARCESSGSVAPFHDNNSLKDDMTWSLDLIFLDVAPAVQNVHERSNGLCEKLGGVLKSSDFTDCILISSDNKEFPAHRVILAAQSTVFAAMFTNEMSEKSTGICRITDIASDNLQIVLEFLYGRTVSDGIRKYVEDIVAVANKYDLEDLRTVCENLMIDSLNAENSVHYLGLSINYGLGRLMKKAAKIVAE